MAMGHEFRARLKRGDRPFIFTNLKNDSGLADVLAWLDAQRSSGLRSLQPDPLGEELHHHHHHH